LKTGAQMNLGLLDSIMLLPKAVFHHTIYRRGARVASRLTLLLDRHGMGEPRRFASFRDVLGGRRAAKLPKSKHGARDLVVSSIK
jgi:hypothetical protein